MEIIKKILLIIGFLVVGVPVALSSGFGKPVSGSGTGDMQKTTYDTDSNNVVDSVDQVGTLTNGKWCTSNGTTIACTTNAPVLSESDPKIATLTSGSFCKGTGTQVSCTDASTYLTAESDPKIATLTSGNFCKGTGTQVSCTDSSTYLTAESDPKVGTLTNTKWCTTNGSVVNCTSDAPSGGSSQWTTTGNDIYYNTGNIVVGATSADADTRGADFEMGTSPVRVRVGTAGGSAATWISAFGDGTTQQTWICQNCFWSTGGGFQMENSGQSAERIILDGTNHTMGFSMTAPGNAAYWNPVFIRMVGGPAAQMGFFTTSPSWQIDAAEEFGTHKDTHLAYDSGVVTVGKAANPSKITMYSPDGTAYSCGPANGGTWGCS